MTPQQLPCIVVIEDDPEMRALLAMVLEHAGYLVLPAANGREGLDLVRAAAPDLILLDVKMPVMNGFEFVNAYRKDHPPADCAPIVLMTAADDPARSAEALHVEGWLGKPVELEHLLAEVGKFARITAEK
jgi:CheY-like chemotaxis protein